MSRITNEQLKNLSDCLQKLASQNNASTPYLAKQIGIPQSTFESYLYGLKAPRIQNLQKLSDYFGVSIDGLLANDIAIKNPIDIKTNINRIVERNESPVEYVTRYISSHFSKTHSNFVDLLSNSDISLVYCPIIDEEEIVPSSAKMTTLDILEKDGLFTDIPDIPDSEENKTLKKLELLNSPNIQKLKELFETDFGTNSEKQIAFDIFYNHLLSGDYDKLALDDFPLNIELYKVSIQKINKIKEAEYINDLFKSTATYSLSEFIDIEEEYLDILISKIFK